MTADGKREVYLNIVKALDREARPLQNALIYCSPLCRTRQSAQILSEVLNAPVHVDNRLIERNFGIYEGTSASNYDKIWRQDKNGEIDSKRGVESVESVAGRLTDLISDLETRHDRCDIFICTHGDVASTLIAMLKDFPLSMHREVGGLQTSEVVYVPRTE